MVLAAVVVARLVQVTQLLTREMAVLAERAL
jgi:hypothetical protein